MYLLFGSQKTLLLDTGASSNAARFPMAAVVNQIRQTQASAIGGPMRDLIVAHTHSHTDHSGGDSQFSGMPGVSMVAPNLGAVKAFYGLPQWPNGSATIDLGGRVVDVIPTPGHEPSHVTLYDRTEQLLLSGDTLYPGLLLVNDSDAYKKSIARLVAFVAANHPVTHVLGAHIEMTSTPGKWFGLSVAFQPNEHVLQLAAPHLHELNTSLFAMGSQIRVNRRADFIIFPADQPLPALGP